MEDNKGGLTIEQQFKRIYSECKTLWNQRTGNAVNYKKYNKLFAGLRKFIVDYELYLEIEEEENEINRK
jgi:hypothetical protein